MWILNVWKGVHLSFLVLYKLLCRGMLVCSISSQFFRAALFSMSWCCNVWCRRGPILITGSRKMIGWYRMRVWIRFLSQSSGKLAENVVCLGWDLWRTCANRWFWEPHSIFLELFLQDFEFARAYEVMSYGTCSFAFFCYFSDSLLLPFLLSSSILLLLLFSLSYWISLCLWNMGFFTWLWNHKALKVNVLHLLMLIIWHFYWWHGYISLQLNDWLDLSLNHSLPSSLLILSRYAVTFYEKGLLLLSFYFGIDASCLLRT